MIAEELHVWADVCKRPELMRVADRIDAEHARHMEQCRRETKRAFAKYLRACISDYEHGIKRVRKPGTCFRAERPNGIKTCSNCGYVLKDDYKHCPHCGRRILED